MCRRSISVLFRNFKECPDSLRQELKKYNAFHDDRSTWQVIYEAPVIIQRFFTHSDYHNFRTTFVVIFLLVCGIGYLLLPHDLLDEEKYGVLGMVDDLGIVGGILVCVSIFIFKEVVSEALH